MGIEGVFAIFLGLLIILIYCLPLLTLVYFPYFLRNRLKNRIWLKDGLIALFILFSQVISFLILNLFVTSHASQDNMLGIIPLLPNLLIFSELENLLPIPIIYILNVVVYFIIGALIGLIVQKIKVARHESVA